MIRPCSSKTTVWVPPVQIMCRAARSEIGELDAVGVCDATAGGEVGGADADQHRGRGAADGGVLAGAGGGVDAAASTSCRRWSGVRVSPGSAKPARSSSG